MIEVANISKTFGDKQALKDISFKLAKRLLFIL